MNSLIQKIPESERPRERCLRKGPQSLSLRECIALILNSGPPGVGSLGLASALLTRPGAGLSEKETERAFFTAMEVSAHSHLAELPGMGEAAHARLLAAFELGRRYALFRSRPNSAPRSNRSSLKVIHQTAQKIPQSLTLAPQEWLGFVPIYRNGETGNFCLVEKGVRTHINIEPSELFARVLALRPSAFVLFHNHPSGDPTPSESDHELTRQVRELARKLGIALLSHGIILPSGDTSNTAVSWINVI